jgi:tetratricopeptide (TPR) repeat protein
LINDTDHRSLKRERARVFVKILLSAIVATTLLLPAMDIHAQDKSGVIPASQGYAGSKSCMECHERFYQLWSTSKHGLAMQPYNAEFAKARLTPQASDVVIGKLKYRADLAKGVVSETGPKGTKQFKIENVLGGKNVYYFLAPFPKGRLQTLPIAYDINKKMWFDTAASGVRHFPGTSRDQPVSWKDPGYTFNTGCYNCHVSQLSNNYNLKTDTYKTTWAEPGINCETCHGPSAEHNRVMKEAPKGQQPKDMKIISVKKFTSEQHNATCSGCHAKMSPVTDSYPPGDRFFDHYDIATLEDPDFYPDGRDLGENYTYTSWLMSPCAKAGKINCITCHTSSGRYRFKAEEKANDACLPCHEKQAKSAPAHTHHKPDSPANKCISCHMPMTSFARMNRTDHSMLPPTPSTTIAYTSPNACNICHTDKDAAWADTYVRQWRTRDYQAPVLKRAALIEGARKRDWKHLPAMLDYIVSKERDEVFATSLIRMVPSSGDPRVAPALIKAMKDPSPLVRGAAADALQHVQTREAAQAVVTASADDYRLVRVRAAASLAAYPSLPLNEAEKKTVEAANKEYLASLTARPDQWSSHYNLGNYYLNRNDPKQAISSYNTSLKLEPRAVLAMVNQSMAYARMGDSNKANESLKKALKVNPGNAAANFNMGLLKAEQNDQKGAEQYLKKALKADPQMAQAAYNLCVITSKDRINEAVSYCKKAAELRPQEPRYAYTLAFYLNQKGDRDEAAKTLKALTEKYPGYKDAEMLLQEITNKERRR